MNALVSAAAIALIATIACSTEVPVTVEVQVPVTRIVPETVEVEVDVTREVNVTREVEVPVTRITVATVEVPVTREVEATREVEVTREVQVTREVDVTREVQVTREVPVTRVVAETVEVPVTRTVQVTRQVPVTRVVQVTREAARPNVADLCSDYPYILLLLQSEYDYWKVSHDLAQRTLRAGSEQLSNFNVTMSEFETYIVNSRSNLREICGGDAASASEEQYEMKTWEGWSACVNVQKRANSLILDEDWDNYYPAVRDAARGMITAYVDYCDNDYFE